MMMPYFELTDDSINYIYDGVARSILSEYANAEGIQAYIGDEVFERGVMSCYPHIDVENNCKDRARFEKRKAKTAAWLKKTDSRCLNKSPKGFSYCYLRKTFGEKLKVYIQILIK